MSKGNVTENEVMKIMFTKTFDPTWRTNDNLYLSLHEADPTESGTQLTNETDYGNYARVAVAKTAAGWTITDNTAVNAALIQFNQCNGGTNTVTHVAIGTDAAGAGQILYSGALNDNLVVSNLIQPQFTGGALQISED